MDTERNKAIMQIPPLHSKNSIQCFSGKITFVRRFVPNFTEIVNPLQQMIKKEVLFKWTHFEKDSFENIKDSTTIAMSL